MDNSKALAGNALFMKMKLMKYALKQVCNRCYTIDDELGPKVNLCNKKLKKYVTGTHTWQHMTVAIDDGYCWIVQNIATLEA